jgi:hypothetical protein
MPKHPLLGVAEFCCALTKGQGVFSLNIRNTVHHLVLLEHSTHLAGMLLYKPRCYRSTHQMCEIHPQSLDFFKH